MTDRQDPELIALGSVMRALDGLERPAQRRVLQYAGQRIDEKVKLIDETVMLESLNKTLEVINQAAAMISRESGESVRGGRVINVIARMYEEAEKAQRETGTDA